MARTARNGVKNKVCDKKPKVKAIVSEKAQQKQFKTEKKIPVRSRKRKVTTNGLDCESAIVSKTSSLVSTGKRKKVSAKDNTDSKIFSQKEKKAFYECLKENGISCLNDESLLEQIFPNRSMLEIKAMIDGFSRKAQDLNRKTEDNILVVGTDPKASKQPIEKWFDLIHQMVPNSSKKDDISAVLIDMLDEYRNECSQQYVIQSNEEILKPNYRAVYDCFAAALNGKYAKQMEPMNAFVVVKLIEELKQSIKNDLNKDEMSFLKSGIWWQIPNLTNAQKTSGDLFKAICSQRQQQNTNELTEDRTEAEYQIPTKNCSKSSDTNDEENQSTDPNEDNIYEDLKTYPKLRKIIECFNPLRVPIELTADEFTR